MKHEFWEKTSKKIQKYADKNMGRVFYDVNKKVFLETRGEEDYLIMY